MGLSSKEHPGQSKMKENLWASYVQTGILGFKDKEIKTMMP